MKTVACVFALVLVPLVARAQVTIYGGPQQTALIQSTWRPDYITKRAEGVQTSRTVQVFANRDPCDSAKNYAEENLRARGYRLEGHWWLTTNPSTGSTIGTTYNCTPTGK
jgi:hypothetical protein